ncbi:MAG: globin [Blastopirellula sp.]|nr:MAG: globin [Blastopirellula sp.]
MNKKHEVVLDSYYRCEDSGGFFDTFYQIFFTKDPSIAPKFANTDMDHQKQIVMASVLMCLRLKTGDPIARRTIFDIGESHSRKKLNIRPELYDLWLDALCESIQKHDPEYTPEIEALWRESMQEAIELIKSNY